MAERRRARVCAAAPRARRRRPVGSLALAGAIAAVCLLGASATVAWAAWAAQATVSGTTVSAGTLDLRFDGGNAAGSGAAYAKTLTLPVTTLTPGESAAFQLTVQNGGSTRFAYAALASAANSGALGLRVFTGTATTQSTAYPRTGSCSGAAIGGQLALTTAGQSALTAARALAPGASETLCLVVSVQSTAPPSLANTAQSIVLDVTAEQGSGP